MSVSRDEVLACLKGLKDPNGSDMVEAGLVRALNVEDGAVRFVMEVASPEPYMDLKAQAEAALAAIGAASVSIIMTAHSAKAPPPDLTPQRKAEPAGPEKNPGVDRIMAVASGKGGAWGCWMRTSMARRSRGCWASLAARKALMAS